MSSTDDLHFSSLISFGLREDSEKKGVIKTIKEYTTDGGHLSVIRALDGRDYIVEVRVIKSEVEVFPSANELLKVWGKDAS